MYNENIVIGALQICITKILSYNVTLKHNEIIFTLTNKKIIITTKKSITSINKIFNFHIKFIQFYIEIFFFK